MHNEANYDDSHDNQDGEVSSQNPFHKKSNTLPLWGNERTMNMNPLLLTNIQSSQYFKVNLYELKTYHEVIDEIYYKVGHVEPWEKGSRKTAGQTGMCGGVRGVGAGGIVSTAFCLLYKLFTLKLTRKQVIGLITHPDSPYIRVLGFMYIRYSQPPADLYDWYEEYLEDEEECDVKAGGGQVMTIGDILKTFLCKLEWFSTLFPRIPVPIQQKIDKKISARFPQQAPGRAYVKEADQSYSQERRKDKHLRDSERSYSSTRHVDSNRDKPYERPQTFSRGIERSRSRERIRSRDRDYNRHDSRSKDYRRDDKYDVAKRRSPEKSREDRYHDKRTDRHDGKRERSRERSYHDKNSDRYDRKRESSSQRKRSSEKELNHKRSKY